MNKHDIMREKVSTWSREARQDMRQYITDCETTEKAYEELQRDVKRYMQLRHLRWCGRIDQYGDKEADEMKMLLEKLSKVGKEE